MNNIKPAKSIIDIHLDAVREECEYRARNADTVATKLNAAEARIKTLESLMREAHRLIESGAEVRAKTLIGSVLDPQTCTREAGHDGACNGFSRDVGGRSCFTPTTNNYLHHEDEA